MHDSTDHFYDGDTYAYDDDGDDDNLLDLYTAREEHVHELTICSPSAQLLNLRKLGLKKAMSTINKIFRGLRMLQLT